jgi:hypothetical protein
MTRTCALLVAIAALLVACGKYGPPRRVRTESTAPATAELAPGSESPEPAISPAAEPEAAAEPAETGEDQEKNQ